MISYIIIAYLLVVPVAWAINCMSLARLAKEHRWMKPASTEAAMCLTLLSALIWPLKALGCIAWVLIWPYRRLYEIELKRERPDA